MSISHGATTRYALVNAAVDRVDLGGGGAGLGKLKFLSALDVLVCTITLQNPAFTSTATSVSQTLNGVPLSGTVLTTGTTISKFYFSDSAGVVVIQGTVGTSGQDINLSSVTPNTGDVIQIDAITYTAPV
jgi:hypothetical protein